MSELNRFDQARYDFMNRALELCYLQPTISSELLGLRDEYALYGMKTTMQMLIQMGFVTMEKIGNFNYYTSHKKHLDLSDYPLYKENHIATLEGKYKAMLQDSNEESDEVIDGVVIPKRKVMPMTQFADKYKQQSKLNRIERNPRNERKRVSVHIGCSFGMIL